ncbi:BTAD domain-containing putative transcriptional regulator [Actinomadura rayongensis]|uniref:LysM domain-containing protein n=1 Tax=Actinomadura rayongensis TaxID=1429076 RepID=A0A6I4W4K8_9ACTN|nr:BTAD domain-containing putative transcriptional regulator [Actinomadura rayongensis]MXQ65619.1 hypothetical protein [Actinomadura rayongensis]
MTSTSQRPARSAGIILRGALALLLLGTLLIGIPLALLLLAGSPVPDHVPTVDGVASGLTSRDDGSLFIGAVEIITWLAWGAFALSCLTELAAFLRGRQAPSLPALNGTQRLAAYLIASIAMAFTAASAQAATAATSPAHAAERAPSTEAPAPQAADQKNHDLPTIHVVRPGESLWGIAEEELGDGDRYKEVFNASRDIKQPRGIPKLTNPRLIHPGERLAIPRDEPVKKKPAPHGEHGQKKTKSSGHQSTTDRGEHPADTPTPHASPPAPTPNPPTDAPTPPAAAPASPEVKAVPAEQTDSTVPAAMLYSGLAASGLVGLLAMKRLIQQRRRKPGQRIRMPEAMSDSEWTIRTSETPDVAELLDRSLRTLGKHVCEAGGALPRIRGIKLHDRDIELFLSDDIPAALPTSPFQSAGEGTLVLDPEQVLPADELGEGPAPYPTLVTLGSAGDRSAVLVDLEVVGTIGLVGSPEDTVEVLTAAAVELATSRLADHLDILVVGFVPELPAVLSSGRLKYMSTVADALAHLENHARDVAESLADAELSQARHARATAVAEGAWNPVVLLSVVAFDNDQFAALQALIPGQGALGAMVRVPGEGTATTAGLVLPAASGELVNLPGVAPIALHRVTSPSYEELLDDFTAASDVESIPDPRWRDVPPEPDDHSEHPETHASRPALVLLPALQSSKEPALPQNSATSTPAEPAKTPETSELTESSQENEATEPSQDATATPYIRVLGRIEVQGRDVNDLEPGKRGLLVELAVFLRLGENPSGEQLSRALGGARGAWSASTRVSNVSRLRAWLGKDSDGNNYVPTQRNRQIYSIENIGCDWTDFENLATRGLRALAKGNAEVGEHDLQRAFALVKGRPFASAGPDRYVWAEHIKQEMIAGIVDVAHVLALINLDAGRYAAARTVVTKGLDIEPGSELLYRDWFRAEHQAGNRQGLNDAAERLLRSLHDLGLEMEPETAELLDRYLNNPFQERKSSRPTSL